MWGFHGSGTELGTTENTRSPEVLACSSADKAGTSSNMEAKAKIIRFKVTGKVRASENQVSETSKAGEPVLGQRREKCPPDMPMPCPLKETAHWKSLCWYLLKFCVVHEGMLARIPQ